jgi:hypothetical protein
MKLPDTSQLDFRRLLSGRILSRRQVTLDLDVREVVGPLLLTRTSVWCYYEMSPQRWSFLAPSQRENLLNRNARRWADLAGRAVKLRLTTRPYAAGQWAAAMDRKTPTPLPDVEGATDYDSWLATGQQTGVWAPLSYNGWIAGQQRRVQQARLDTKMCAIGVRICDRPPRLSAQRLAEAMTDPESAPPRQLVELISSIRRIDQAMAGPGFGCKPMDSTDLEWLIHRSCAPGIPAPARLGLGGALWTSDDLMAFTDAVDWTYEPFGRTVRVRAHRDGSTIERHIAVLTAGRMEELVYPESGKAPWMTYGDRLEHAVEWSLSGRILAGRELEKDADFQRLRTLNIGKHYAEHNEKPPRAVSRAILQSEEIVDEITEGTPEVAARFCGVVRAAVVGASEEEAISRAQEFIDRYADDIRIQFEHPVGQHTKLAEFVPGQRWESVGYQRWMPVRYLAAAVPHTSAAIGDGEGPYIGYAAGTSRYACMLDSNYSTEVRKRSGLCPIIADPGAGKSFLTGVLIYHEVRRYVQTVVLDPSGPLARLCSLPELAPFAVHRSLTDGAPGSLNPCALVLDPLREDHDSDKNWSDELARVHQQRKEILLDTLRGLVPFHKRALADELLPRATRDMTISVDTSPWEVVYWLENRLGESGRDLADLLRDVAQLPEGALILGEPDSCATPENPSAMLTVMTMAGVQLPPENLKEEQWTLPMRLAQPLLNLGILSASRFVYTGSPNRRRALHLDEVHFLRNWGSGSGFFNRLARDSRKRNTAVYASSQVPGDVLDLGVASLYTHAFVGRIEDESVAEEALRLVRTPTGYTATVTGLSHEHPGEFLYRDVFGRVQKVRIDADWLPHLRAALFTNPDGSASTDYSETMGAQSDMHAA